MGEESYINEKQSQKACYAASTICLLGGVLLGTVGVSMVIFGLYSTDKLEDQVWQVSLLIIGTSFVIIMLGSLGCACSCSRQMLLNREESIIKCIAFHASMSENPEGTATLPPCCTRNLDTMKVWSTMNPHSRLAWNSEIPGQAEEQEEEEEAEEEKIE